jgi:N-sulfoglucosamine sulfohydrolase
MKFQPIAFILIVCGFFSTYCASPPEKSPNILFIIADDASFHTMSKHGADFVETPNFDQIAEKGVLFLNTYSNNPKCAPARSSLLTGRYSWQLEEAVVHRPLMPEKWKFYPELLGSEGYFVGHTGKGWGPGLWKRGEHNPAGKSFNDERLAPPFTGISDKNYSGNFKVFLENKPSEAPFCFWLGTHEPHRGYEKDSYKKAGKSLENAEVQDFFPDNDIIRGDLLDYALEVEWFDKQIGEAIQILEEKGELENTVIIVTSDHGMPFPRVKGQIYKEGVHVPLAIRWDAKIKAGRVVNDFINFPDFAPTIMELAGLEPHPQMTGSSFLDILLSSESGWINKSRNFSILGKERHDIGRDDGDEIAVGYPVRGIITDRFLYTVNYEPQRWPAGNPEHGFKNSDDGPTEDYLVEISKDSLHQDFPFFELAFSFRPTEELFDLREDPDCIQNLAFSQEYSSFKDGLSKKMTSELKNHKDPRILGYGDVFDTYYYMGFEAMKEMYGDRFVVPENLKQYEHISNGKVE